MNEIIKVDATGRFFRQPLVSHDSIPAGFISLCVHLPLVVFQKNTPFSRQLSVANVMAPAVSSRQLSVADVMAPAYAICVQLCFEYTSNCKNIFWNVILLSKSAISSIAMHGFVCFSVCVCVLLSWAQVESYVARKCKKLCL